jgi:hypothetical protein
VVQKPVLLANGEPAQVKPNLLPKRSATAKTTTAMVRLVRVASVRMEASVSVVLQQVNAKKDNKPVPVVHGELVPEKSKPPLKNVTAKTTIVTAKWTKTLLPKVKPATQVVASVVLLASTSVKLTVVVSNVTRNPVLQKPRSVTTRTTIVMV